MKILYAVFIAASAIFLALSPVGLLIGFSIHDLQAEVQRREADLQTLDEQIEKQKQALQVLAERKAVQEKQNDELRKQLQNQQQALQVQQVQIAKGVTLSQQVWPSLIRDVAAAAANNERMKEVLLSHGL